MRHLLPLLLACGAGAVEPADAPASTRPAMTDAARDHELPELSAVAELTVQAVVRVDTERARPARFDPELPDELRDFFGPGLPDPRPSSGTGSGVILDAGEGLVATNHHVIQGATRVRVQLASGAQVNASVVGADPKTDLALLQLDRVPPGLVALPWGDSQEVRLGEWVLAIGHPFGVGPTVTQGIISAKGRSELGIADYEEFLQTDAAINPGNSGGALVNRRGELVGIPTAIFSRSGGSQGIGFAIPAATARRVVEALRTEGVVRRGWLGVLIQDLDGALAEALGVEDGVLAADVIDDSPGERLGLKAGDVILALDDQPVTSRAAFRAAVAAKGPDTKVVLDVDRGGKRLQLTGKLGELPQETDELPRGTSEGDGARLGVSVRPLGAAGQGGGELPEDVRSGAVIEQVEPDSPAEALGLRPGDVLIEVNRQEVSDAASLRQALKKPGVALLVVVRGGQRLWLAWER